MTAIKKYAFSHVSAFIVIVMIFFSSAHAQTEGAWAGRTNEGGDVFFVVNGDSTQSFLIEICVYGGTGSPGGCFEQYLDLSMDISGDSFSYSSTTFDLIGNFTSSTTASGTWLYGDGLLGYGNGTWFASYPAQPNLKISPLSKSFGEQLVGTSSDVFSFRVYNSGGGTATGSASLAGPNKDQFEILSGSGNFSLSHGESKEIRVQFSPTSTGVKTATLMTGSSSSEDPSASLSGTGTYPTLEVNPLSKNVTDSNGSTTYWVYNSGPGNLDWIAERNPADTWLTITGGSSGTNGGTLSVEYEANYYEARTGSITVTAENGDNSPLIIELHQDEGSPQVALEPATHNFRGEVVDSASDAVTFTLTNAKGGTATGSIEITGTDSSQFEITGGGENFSLMHGQTQDVRVRFTPTSEGLKTATLQIAGDAPANDINAPLQGTGRLALLSVEPLFHDVQSAGGSVSFEVTNAGTGTMDWVAKTPYGLTWMGIISGSAGTDSGTITVHYSANYGAARTGSVVVTAANGANSPLVVQVRQAEGTPYLDVTPSNWNFGRLGLNSLSDEAIFTLSNPEGGIATGSVSLGGQDTYHFEILSGGGNFSLSPDESKEIRVRFKPVSFGLKAATLMVEGDTPANDVAVALNGIGTHPETKLTASDATINDKFGNSVSISGDYAIVGAFYDSDNGGYSGSAYIYEQEENGWIEQVKFSASDGASGDNFGYSVSISGNYAIVGAKGDDDNGSLSGSAYIFEQGESGWLEVAKLTPDDGAESDYFGIAVSISGNFAIVGADGDDDNGSSSGSAYVFVREGSVWAQRAKLTPSDGAASEFFGCSVSISGNHIIVGADKDDNNGSSSGAAYIFEKPAAGWSDMTETAKLTPATGAANDYFGNSVAISGDIAIVAAYQNDDNGSNSGAVYLFEKPTEGWRDSNETARLSASNSAAYKYFGGSVGISGDMAIVGSQYGSHDGVNVGLAYIFEKPTGGWGDMTETAILMPLDGELDDRFGGSVALSGDYALIGAAEDDDDGSASGSAYVYYVGNFSLTISDISDQETNTGIPAETISFHASDPDTPPASLLLTATSSNNTLLTNENIVFGGSGEERTITLTPEPGMTGSTTITVMVGDGNITVSESFLLNVLALRGDITGDGHINLEDVLTALKVLAGYEPDNISPAGEIGQDGKVGMEEVLYDLNFIKDNN